MLSDKYVRPSKIERAPRNWKRAPKGRGKFVIECRVPPARRRQWTPGKWCEWHVFRYYHTERQREDALAGLNKSCHLYEYRKAPCSTTA